MVCTLIDHRNDINMFKTQVEPRDAGELFHCKEYKPCKIVVDLFLRSILTVFKSIFYWSFLEYHAREKEQNKLYHHDIIPWSVILLNI